jgi:hypothetical protein
VDIERLLSSKSKLIVQGRNGIIQAHGLCGVNQELARSSSVPKWEQRAREKRAHTLYETLGLKYLLRCQLSRRELIHVTPDPRFSRLNGTHQRMFAAMKVLGGVLVLRRIATAHVPALQA